MPNGFVKVERKDVEEKSGLYKIVFRDTGDTYIGFSSTNLKNQIATQVAVTVNNASREDNLLAQALLKYGRDSYDIYVQYLSINKEQLTDIRNMLIEELKPSLIAYSHHVADDPFKPPVLTVTDEQLKVLSSSMIEFKQFLEKNKPDYAEVYILLLALIKYPEQSLASLATKVGGALLRESTGEAQCTREGVAWLATNKKMQWNMDKTFRGMGKVPSLTNMANLMNNRDLIEYADNPELKNQFYAFLDELIKMGNEYYKVDINLDYDFKVPEPYKQYDWQVQYRTQRGNSGYMIGYAANALAKVGCEVITTENLLVR